jgi:hypothetical protein
MTRSDDQHLAVLADLARREWRAPWDPPPERCSTAGCPNLTVFGRCAWCRAREREAAG